MSDSSQGPGWWLASDGKWYAPQGGQPPQGYQQPQQGYQQPPPGYYSPPAQQKKGHGCLYAILGAVAVVMVLIVVIVIAVSAGSKKVNNALNGGTTTKASYKIGESARSGPLSFIVYGVTNAPPPAVPEVTQPGTHLVSVDVQVTNPGSAQRSFSSLLGFHLLDDQNRQYDEQLAGLSPGAPDGEIAAGQSIRGNVLFQVPDGTAGLKLRVQGEFTAAGAVFALS